MSKKTRANVEKRKPLVILQRALHRVQGLDKITHMMIWSEFRKAMSEYKEPKKLGKIERAGRYDLEEVIPFIRTDNRNPHSRDYDGHQVWMDGERLVTFYRNLKCVKCGLKGLYFALERHLRKDGTPAEIRYHLNLYALDKNGREILMTKDHIIPRSKGGSNSLSNLQTMCQPCNSKKGNKDD